MGGVVYNYYYVGSQLARMTYGTTVLDFFYDATGVPVAMRQGSTTSSNYTVYYYITNLQGDVIRLVDVNGSTAAYYEYDPYGKAIQAAGSHATINPLRYRGYVYDTETGFYYLQSRYYDPQIGRFINADALVSTGQGLLGNNMFAYCRNNPVCRVDISGTVDAKCYDVAEKDAVEIPGEEDIGPGGGNRAIDIGGGSSLYKDVIKEHNSFANRTTSVNKSGTVSAGVKPEVHHIVEQCQINKSGFSETQIQDKSNKVVIPKKLHQLISAHYSSILDSTSGMRVRDWLAGQPFEFQYQYGLSKLEEFWEVLYGIKND